MRRVRARLSVVPKRRLFLLSRAGFSPRGICFWEFFSKLFSRAAAQTKSTGYSRWARDRHHSMVVKRQLHFLLCGEDRKIHCVRARPWSYRTGRNKAQGFSPCKMRTQGLKPAIENVHGGTTKVVP